MGGEEGATGVRVHRDYIEENSLPHPSTDTKVRATYTIV